MNCVHWKSALISVFVQKMRRHDKVRWMHTNFFCLQVLFSLMWRCINKCRLTYMSMFFYCLYCVGEHYNLAFTMNTCSPFPCCQKICTICSFSFWMTNRSECNRDIVFVNCATGQKCLLIVAVVVMLHNEANIDT